MSDVLLVFIPQLAVMQNMHLRGEKCLTKLDCSSRRTITRIWGKIGGEDRRRHAMLWDKLNMSGKIGRRKGTKVSRRMARY